MIEAQLACDLRRTLICKQTKRMYLNMRRGEIDGDDTRGMFAAPAGSMDGVYKSMFPKLFFGIFPYVRRIS
jgi:hypothetical protein